MVIKMKWECKIYLLDEEENKLFGNGPLTLLKKTDEFGSLHKAAMEMNMAYSKAFKIIRNSEDRLGFPLMIRTTGGKSGGGSILSDEAKKLISQYELFEHRVRCRIEEEFQSIFISDHTE